MSTMVAAFAPIESWLKRSPADGPREHAFVQAALRRLPMAPLVLAVALRRPCSLECTFFRADNEIGISLRQCYESAASSGIFPVTPALAHRASLRA